MNALQLHTADMAAADWAVCATSVLVLARCAIGWRRMTKNERNGR